MFEKITSQSVLEPANDAGASNRRAGDRTDVFTPCWFTHEDVLHTGHIIDISATGARIKASYIPEMGSSVLVRHAVGGPISAVVRRHGAVEFAVEFYISVASVGFMLRVISAHMTRYDSALQD
jgi:PilZ domain